MKREIQHYIDTATSIVKEVGQVVRTHIGRQVTFSLKAERDPVTRIEVEIEKTIIHMLKEQFPAHGLLCEESGFQPGADPYCWIIDPLDGTMNFLHGYPHFCISIALQQENTNLIGVIYQPSTDELYTAALGHGAFLNKESLRVSDTTNIAESVLEIGFDPSSELRQLQHEIVGRQLQYCGAIRERGSAALGLCAVARGVCDGYCELGVHLWDIAAGALLVTEAGGRVTQRNAQTLSNNTVDILASNAVLHHQFPF